MLCGTSTILGQRVRSHPVTDHISTLSLNFITLVAVAKIMMKSAHLETQFGDSLVWVMGGIHIDRLGQKCLAPPLVPGCYAKLLWIFCVTGGGPVRLAQAVNHFAYECFEDMHLHAWRIEEEASIIWHELEPAHVIHSEQWGGVN